jgi:hypothetical protein
VAIVFISMGAFTYYSFNTYIRWKNYPVILGFDEQLTDIFEIPFPAVSIKEACHAIPKNIYISIFRSQFAQV